MPLENIETELISLVQYRLIYALQNPEIVLKNHLPRTGESSDTRKHILFGYMGDLLTIINDYVHCQDLATVFNAHADSIHIETVAHIAPEIAQKMEEEFIGENGHDDGSFNSAAPHDTFVEEWDGQADPAKTPDDSDPEEADFFDESLLLQRNPNYEVEQIEELPHEATIASNIKHDDIETVSEALSIINQCYFMDYVADIDEDSFDEPGLSDAFREAYLWVESAIADLSSIKPETPGYLVKTAHIAPTKVSMPVGAKYH